MNQVINCKTEFRVGFEYGIFRVLFEGGKEHPLKCDLTAAMNHDHRAEHLER